MYGFGLQAYFACLKRKKGFSLSCILPRRFGFAPLTGMWRISFPHIVSARSDIFEFVRAGNLEGVKSMFDLQKATPWDTTLDGRGLLHV
jgi:hypothetical protein